MFVPISISLFCCLSHINTLSRTLILQQFFFFFFYVSGMVLDLEFEMSLSCSFLLKRYSTVVDIWKRCLNRIIEVRDRGI